MADTWRPKRTLQECHDILTKTPGSLFEVEMRLVDGQVQKVYKNLPGSLRRFWLDYSKTYADREYIVFEESRYTYGQIAAQAAWAASVFRNKYNIHKGDRIAIISRNYPEWIVAFWACQLLSAVAVPVNAWLPFPAMKHCIELADCKLLLLDTERALTLRRWISDLTSSFMSKVQGVLVLRPDLSKIPDGHPTWAYMKNWNYVMDDYDGLGESWIKERECTPEELATIFFTSGTTGLPKGVPSSHRAFLSNWPNLSANRARHFLRQGLSIPSSKEAPQSSTLLINPLFHVMGTTAYLTTNTATGGKIVLMQKWDKETAVGIIEKEQISNISGVPYTIMELIDSKAEGKSIRWLGSGGASAPSTLAREAVERFPGAVMSQGYGLTETNANCGGISGMDCVTRPTSAGLPGLVNDFLIVDVDSLQVLPTGRIGELWIRGPNVLKEYYRDPKATAKAITQDGWFRSGDLGYLDDDGFMYIVDRAKDVIIRGGENIDSTTVENALYRDPRIRDCAAVGVPDRKLGELVAVAVVAKEQYRGLLDEQELITSSREHLPGFAVPVMVFELEELPHNGAGKVQKSELRRMLKEVWVKRKKHRRVPRSKL